MAKPPADVDALIAKLGNVPQVTFVNQTRVSCNGGDGALGHPLTYYTIGDEGYVVCGYCDHVFIYAPERVEA